AVWIFVLGAVFLVILCSYAGLLIYATYYDCDPLTTQIAKRTDQLLPLLMMRTIGHLPGLSGCFIAGVFSAALSSMSTSLNSMSAVVLEDFYKTFFKTTLTEKQTNILMKSVVVITGIICVCLVVVVEKLGSILQMALSLVSITNGPTLGLFSMGLFFPWINTLGVITGGTVGLLFIGWVIIGTQTAIAAGTISFDKMPISVDGCTYNYSLPVTNETLLQEYTDQTRSDVFGLYRISYLWYTLVGCLVSVLVGLIVSFATGANDPQKVDPRLLSPSVAWIFADEENEKQRTVQPVLESPPPQDVSESTAEKTKRIAA
ncbi:Putative sodium-dependent multivitamin transporter, partial [Gryllus bimaculatus]